MASRKDVQDIMGLAAGEALPKMAPLKKAKPAMQHKRLSKCSSVLTMAKDLALTFT
jgi:hypothetical protein